MNLDSIILFDGDTYRVEQPPAVLAYDHQDDGTLQPRYHPQAPRVLVKAGQFWHVVLDPYIRRAVLDLAAGPGEAGDAVEPAAEPADESPVSKRRDSLWRDKFADWLKAEIEAGRVVGDVRPLGRTSWKITAAKRDVFDALQPLLISYSYFDTRTRPNAFEYEGSTLTWAHPGGR